MTYTLSQLRELVVARLNELIDQQAHPAIYPLFEAARYSLLSPGKRLRPLLTLVTAQMYGSLMENALTPACALELIHSYSLIHDDLPCMDDDDLRRGKPTLHKVYDEGFAVLTGDFLLTYAFELLSKAPALSAETRLVLIQTLAERAGAEGMIGGQVIDLHHNTIRLSQETIELMHMKKTAALFSCALEFGGHLGHASQEEILKLKEIGENFGSAFQIFDDLSDAGEKGCSCLKIYSCQEAQDLAEQKLSRAHRTLTELSTPSTHLRECLDLLHMQEV